MISKLTASDFDGMTVLVDKGGKLICKGSIAFTEEGRIIVDEDDMLEHYDIVILNEITIDESINCKVLHVAIGGCAVALEHRL